MTRQPSQPGPAPSGRGTGTVRYRRPSRRTTHQDTTVTSTWPPRLNTSL